MSAKTKPCPKCGAPAPKTGGHGAAHPAHVALHGWYRGHPILALIGAVGTLIALTGVTDSYRCDRCNHTF